MKTAAYIIMLALCAGIVVMNYKLNGQLKLNDPSRAIVVEPVDERQEKTEEITCIVMPMIVGE